MFFCHELRFDVTNNANFCAMTPEEKAKYILDKMMEGDRFSQWLGIMIRHIAPGACIAEMKLRDEMLNGFHIAHGGICYALADSALAFASNSYGPKAVSVETSISHTRKVETGDTLRAETEELNRTHRFALYQVIIRNQRWETVAVFKGTVYYTGDSWE